MSALEKYSGKGEKSEAKFCDFTEEFKLRFEYEADRTKYVSSDREKDSPQNGANATVKGLQSWFACEGSATDRRPKDNREESRELGERAEKLMASHADMFALEDGELSLLRARD